VSDTALVEHNDGMDGMDCLGLILRTAYCVPPTAYRVLRTAYR